MKTYVLLTPGPLTTSKGVKSAMQYDIGTRDQDYYDLLKDLRNELLELAHASPITYSCILLQGSGTYGVESVLTSTIKPNQKVLILSNGSYGDRMEAICRKANVPYIKKSYSMIHALPLHEIEKEISQTEISHVAYVHCETTAGILNDIQGIQTLIHKHNKLSIVDAMSSFGSLEISLDELDIDYLITSSNKCLHGTPGIAIIYAKKKSLDTCEGTCSSLSLDLYEQYRFMEDNGSFRFTSPTHVILSLNQAIKELKEEGGIAERSKRYYSIQKRVYDAMKNKGFETLVPQSEQSPIITTYLAPFDFNFHHFYEYFKANGFLLYSGKLPNYDAFRIGNIGCIRDEDIHKFIQLLNQYQGGQK